MAKFLSELDIRLKPKSDKVFVVKFPLIYESDILGLIDVPIGFETDFASVPRIPFIYAMYGGRVHREAVLHDYLYRKDSNPIATYSQANGVFFEAMQVRKKKRIVRYGMYYGVCLGGWMSFHKKNVTDKL